MSEWKPPKTKLRFESEVEPVPTMVVIKTEFAVDYEKKDASGNPVVTPTETVKRVKLKSFTVSSNSEKFAQAVIDKSDLLPANALSSVVKLLESLKRKISAASESVGNENNSSNNNNSNKSQVVIPETSVTPATATPAVGKEEEESMTTPTASKQKQTTFKQPPPTSHNNTNTTHTQKEVSREHVIDDRVVVQPTVLATTMPKKSTTAVEEDSAPTVSVQNATMIVAHKTHELGRKGLRKKVLKRKEQEPANIKSLEKYQSQLYEDDVSVKIRATGQILQLVQNPQYLGTIVSHNTLVTALARILAEDRKRSTALVANVLEIFFCFSSIRELHPIQIQHKIGVITMSVIDLEQKRYNARKQDDTHVHTCNGVLFDAMNTDIVNPCKVCNVTQLQERQLFVCLYVLLNLAENVHLEAKMVQRQLVLQVATVLTHENIDHTYLQHLHLLGVAFLKKMSLVRDNVVAMYKECVPARICKLLMTGLVADRVQQNWCVVAEEQDCILANATLRLCYNLCFYPPARAFQLTMLPILAPRVTHAATAQMAIRVLYHLSTDPHSLPYVVQASQPYLTAIVHTLIATPGQQSDHELAALALNLASHARAARVMALPDGASLLLARAIRTKDVLLYRIVRVLISHSFIQPILSQFTLELAAAATNMRNAFWANEARLEAAMLLIYTDIRGMKFDNQFKQYPLGDIILQYLSSYKQDSDNALIGVCLLGTFLIDSNCANILGTPKIISITTSITKQAMEEEDYDLLVQCLFCIFRMLHHSRLRSILITEKSIWDISIRCCGHENECIRHYGECCTDVLVEYGNNRARDDAIRRRFEQYNKEYMELIHTGALDEVEYEDEDLVNESEWRTPGELWQNVAEEDDEYITATSIAAVRNLP